MTTLRGALILFASIAIAVASGSAVASAQSDSVEVHLRVEDGRLRVEISDMSAPVGVIEARITGLPAEATMCEVAGLGGCNLVDGVAQVAALDPEGFDGATDLVIIELPAAPSPDAVQVLVGPTYDVTGQPMTVIAGSSAVVVESESTAPAGTDQPVASTAPAAENSSSETATSAPASEAPALGADADESGSSSSALVLGLAGAVGLAVAAWFVLRRRA